MIRSSQKNPARLDERGSIKAGIGITMFLMLSFALTFGGVWVALVGPVNPFEDHASRRALDALSGADSLRAEEIKLAQEVRAKTLSLDELRQKSDSLSTLITTRTADLTRLEARLDDLDGKLTAKQQERMKKLAGIVSGLNNQTLRQMTEDIDTNTLVSLVLNTSARKAQALLNAMDPRKAAAVTKKVAHLKERNGG